MKSKWEVAQLLPSRPSKLYLPGRWRDVWSHLWDLGEKNTAPRNRKCGLAEPLHHTINSWQLWEYLTVLETQENGNEQKELKGGRKGTLVTHSWGQEPYTWETKIKGAPSLIKWGHSPLSRHSRAKITHHLLEWMWEAAREQVCGREYFVTKRQSAHSALQQASSGPLAERTPRLCLLIRGQQLFLPIISSQLNS